MPSPLPSAHAVGLSPSAQSEGQLIGILFQIRDDYVQAHNLVFGNPITRVLRSFRVLRTPRLSEVAVFVEVQLRLLDAASSGLTGLPLSRLRLKDSVQYFNSLRRAMSGLHVLLKDSSARNLLPPASSATRIEYQIAAQEFGTVGDRLRRQGVSRSEYRSRVSPEPGAGFTSSPAVRLVQVSAHAKPTIPADHSKNAGSGERSAAQPRATPQAIPADERWPVEISIDLAGRLFKVATIGMQDFARPLLEQIGVDREVFRRLELEGLFLRLFTGRTAFLRETDQDDQHKTEVLNYFDKLVAMHFGENPDHARMYAERSEAYRLAAAASEDFEETLGSEYSRLCRWEGERAVALGASQAIVMVVTAREAVIDYASNPLRAILAEG
jgi:hypothetical protein